MYVGVRSDVRASGLVWRFPLCDTLLIFRAQRFVVSSSQSIADPQSSFSLGLAISYRRQYCLPVRCAPGLVELVDRISMILR